jgi:hypothetical protein
LLCPGSVEWNPREQEEAATDAVVLVVDLECIERAVLPVREDLIVTLRMAFARVDPALANVLVVMTRQRN